MSQKKSKMSGLRKVAIIMMMLGIDDASQVAKHLNQMDVKEIAKITSSLDNITKTELDSILKEFYEEISGSSDMVRFDPEFSSEILSRNNGEDKLFSLNFLSRADVNQLFEIIKREHPQVIAFVLSFTAPEKAAELLKKFSPEIQADLAFRISVMEPPNRLALKYLDQMLGEKLSYISSSSAMEIGGVDSLVRIIKGVGRNSEQVILEYLNENHPDLGEQVKNKMFVFEDIVLLDNKSVQKLLKDVDTRTLALALKKTTDEIQDLIMKNLSERARMVLKEEISSLGKVPLKDVETAQQEIVETLREMEESGEIKLRKEDEIYV